MLKKKIRIGIVPFFNAKPLTYYLNQVIKNSEIISDVPSLLEKKLINNEIDLALLSSICYADLYPEVKMLPKMGIISKGPVKSVNLFLNPKIIKDSIKAIPGANRTFRLERTGRTPADTKQDVSIMSARHETGCFNNSLPPKAQNSYELAANIDLAVHLKRIALDPASRSSNVMLKILLKSTFPQTVFQFRMPSLSESLVSRIQNHHATLVIGDDALRLTKNYYYWDLGRWWSDIFRKPFVYALWLAKKNINSDILTDQLYNVLLLGLKNKEKYINHTQKSIMKNKLDKKELLSYITENIYYKLEENELKGLIHYFEELKKQNFIKEIPPI